jgi:protein arginine kinase activator
VQCEMCQKLEATVRIKQVLAGKLRETWVCEQCAELSAKEAYTAPSLTSLLAETAATPSAKRSAKESICCPRCGMGLSEIFKRRQFGCAVCYEALAEHVKPFVDDMQGCLEHRGKIPSRERGAAAILQVRHAMENAVKQQDFEAAARYRDQLRSLETAPAPKTTKGRRE